MKTCFFTLLESGYSSTIEYELFEKSFKYFHPEIPLFTLRDDEISKLKSANSNIDMYNIKASAAKLFYNDYDLVVNIDSDHFIFGRLDEILKGDYDVASPSSHNLYENVDHITIRTYLNNMYQIIPTENYRHAGIVASTSKNFWDTYEAASIKHARHMTCRDNDVLNMVIEFGNFKYKVLDGAYHCDDSTRRGFYGCSSLNKEHMCEIVNDIVCINDIPLKCYHVAKGSNKPKFNQLFKPEIANWLYERLQ